MILIPAPVLIGHNGQEGMFIKMESGMAPGCYAVETSGPSQPGRSSRWQPGHAG